MEDTFHPHAGDQFQFLFANSFNGNFARYILPVFDGLTFAPGNGAGGLMFTVQAAAAATPEPAAWLLVAGGLHRHHVVQACRKVNEAGSMPMRFDS